jgi:hypothetical protein
MLYAHRWVAGIVGRDGLATHLLLHNAQAYCGRLYARTPHAHISIVVRGINRTISKSLQRDLERQQTPTTGGRGREQLNGDRKNHLRRQDSVLIRSANQITYIESGWEMIGCSMTIRELVRLFQQKRTNNAV